MVCVSYFGTSMPRPTSKRGVNALGRKLPVSAPDMAVLAKPREPLFELDIAVVTPLFGGGSVPGVTDDAHPVRAASVRGHLRFWWRACMAGAFATANDLFKGQDEELLSEERIWGSTAMPGRIGLSVETLHAGTEVSCMEKNDRSRWRWVHGYPGYALFPFESDKDGKPPAHARKDVRFRLRVGVAAGLDDAVRDKLRAAAEASLWAWITFGGIGARTRRGCGSLYCAVPPFAPPAQAGAPELTTWLHQSARRYVAPQNRRLPVPSLHGAQLLLGPTKSDPLPTWESAVNLLRDYRQGKGVDRHAGQQRGRSLWPEPDSIRRLTKRNAPNHQPTHPADFYYPRADLGLPIIFHFKDSDAGDPRDSTLQAAGGKATRMASPIIVKALAVSDQQAIPLALCLDAPHVWEGPRIELKIGDSCYTIDKNEIVDSGKSRDVSPLVRQGGAVDARDGFMRYAADALHGQEVRL